VLVAIAGTAGWLLGGLLQEDGRAPASATERVARTGALRVLVDSSWTPAAPGRELAAAGLTELSAFAPVPGLPSRTWIAGAPVDGPTLVPASVRARVGTLPAPEKATLGGHPAWRYPAMELRSGGMLELTTLPTTAGMLLVGCEASKTSWTTVVGCSGSVRAVGGASVLPPASDLAFRERVKPVVTKLNARRTGAGRALRRAGRARGQQAAAKRLAAAHAAAAAALAPLAPASGPAHRAVAQLTVSARAYRALAAAAGQRAPRRYRRARTATRRADRALRAALAAATR
jgi:hypothetical protein